MKPLTVRSKSTPPFIRIPGVRSFGRDDFLAFLVSHQRGLSHLWLSLGPSFDHWDIFYHQQIFALAVGSGNPADSCTLSPTNVTHHLTPSFHFTELRKQGTSKLKVKKHGGCLYCHHNREDSPLPNWSRGRNFGRRGETEQPLGLSTAEPISDSWPPHFEQISY